MDKRELVTAFTDHFRRELDALERAARATYEAAIHPESAAEDPYDTRGLEASYLAGAQAKRVKETRSTIGVLRATPVEPLSDADAIRPGALVELEDENGERQRVLLALAGGGAETELKGETIRIVTPRSPLGAELVGREAGDDFELELPTGWRSYEIVTVR